jgi:hypothetical protein
MFKNVFVFSFIFACSCACQDAKTPSSNPKCITSFLVAEGCIIQNNSCNNPVKSKEDFDERCKTEENMMFQKPSLNR